MTPEERAKAYLAVLQDIALRARYIVGMCRGEQEMIAEAQAIVRLADGVIFGKEREGS